MNGAIFFTSKYGRTAQYAGWIRDATGLPIFDVKDPHADPAEYDFLVLGSPVYFYKLLIRKWIMKNQATIENRPTILFTVSGASSGPKLDDWVAGSMPGALMSKVEHVALRGRQSPREVTWWHRLLLKIAAMRNKDPAARREELEGFDYMDRSSIDPVVELVREWRT